MQPKKLLMVVNPLAGKRKIRSVLLDVVDLFVKAGYEPTVLTTQREQDLAALVRERAEDYDLLVCSGGDGTFNETLAGLLACGRQPLLGYIPSGTTNDFATGLHLPKDPIKAAQTILQGKEFVCDAGRMGERCFSYVAAFGAFVDVVYETPQQAKNLLGRMAYMLEGIRRVADIKTYHVRVEYEGGTLEDDVILGLVTNSTSVGGFKTGGRLDVKMDDGLFEVMLVKRPQSAAELQTVVNSLLKQELDFNFMYNFSTPRLCIETDSPLSWTLDGEYGATTTRAEIENLPRAFRILVPADAVEESEG